MADYLTRFYQRLPAPARSAAASLRGYYLHWWRYGPQTEQHVAEALAREGWDESQWREWRTKRLTDVLERAATRVPYYRQYWQRHAARGEGRPWTVLENWPVLKKEELRASPELFLADDCNPRRLFQEHTSGTTGTPLTLWCRREMVQFWYALAEARWRRWYGVSRRDRWAIIGGQKIVPFTQSTPPFWVWNAGLKQLYMSALHARPDYLNHYLKALERYSITYLYGYSSTLYWLALQALESNLRPRLKVIITNAEPLYPYQREVITEAFACPVRETYGLGEMCCAMSECEHEKLHLWPEVGVTELLDEEDRPVPAGTAGRMICTGLLNDAMPLVRLEVRDMAQFAADSSCACGRLLPLVEKVTGRLDDTIVTKDNRRIALLDIIFGPELHVREAQIIQETLEDFRVKVVPAAGWSPRDAEAIRTAMRQHLGQVEVSVEIVSEIERTWAGKFRVLISKVAPAPQRGSAEARLG